MSTGVLPNCGPTRQGSIVLPPGRRIFGWNDDAPRLWATSEPVPDAGRVWRELTGLSGETGLVPIVLAFLDGGHEGRPWDEGELEKPNDLASVGSVAATTVLAENWSGNLPDDEEEFDEDAAAEVAPFGLRFPGLAPRQNHSLADAEAAQALNLIGSARIGLVPASRPADVLALIGHDTVNRDSDPRPLAAVLRSWEDRFGATLLEVGFAHIRLLAQRPPRALPDAQAVAAELWAMCDEFWPAGTMTLGRSAAARLVPPADAARALVAGFLGLELLATLDGDREAALAVFDRAHSLARMLDILGGIRLPSRRTDEPA